MRSWAWLIPPFVLGTSMIWGRWSTATTLSWTAWVMHSPLCWNNISQRSKKRCNLDAKDSTGHLWVWRIHGPKCLFSGDLMSVKLKMDQFCLVLGINDFIKRGSQSVSKFESVVNQIQMNEKEIESKLQVIGMASILKFSVPDNDLPGVISFIWHDDFIIRIYSIPTYFYCLTPHFCLKVSKTSLNVLSATKPRQWICWVGCMQTSDPSSLRRNISSWERAVAMPNVWQVTTSTGNAKC